MAVSSVSGISSGIDWVSMVNQLRAVEENRVTPLQEQKSTYEEKLSVWQDINSQLLSFKTAAGTLNRPKYFNLYTTSLSSNTSTDAEDIMSATAGTDAGPGTYDIVVNSLAAAQKLSSAYYASQTTALSLSGDIIVGGRTVKVSTTDSLTSLRDKINAVNTGTNPSGVTASIVDYGTSGYRLILASDEEGTEGISILNGGSSNLVGSLGFVDASAKTAKNAITGGNKSDAFSSETAAIGGSTLLDLTSPQSGTVTITINGTAQSVAINLSTDSLDTIRDAINTAFSGVFASDPASVVSETVDGTTKYRLLIEGNTITYTDANNVLETLGVIERAGVSDERGVTGDVTNTSGGAAITSSTRFDQIDGYIDYATTDTIALTGTDTNGAAVSTSFSIYSTDYKTIGDLLSAIEAAYGDVTASVTADGKIQVADNEIGDTDLVVILTPSSSELSFDTDNNFGAIATIRERQLQAGAKASITVDGVTVTPSSNTVDDVITDVTLNLKRADASTTVTLTVGRDYDAVKQLIQDFVDSYNTVMDKINEQMTYNEDTQQPGGPLFGDSTLRTIKSDLTDIVISSVTGVSDNFSTLGQVGISIGTDSKLTIDDTTLQGYLETNFEDVKKLFAADWSSTNSSLSYVSHYYDTQSGTYDLYVDTGGSPDDYFAKDGQNSEASQSSEFFTGVSGDPKNLLVRYSGSSTGNVGSITLTYGVAELFDRDLYYVTDSTYGYMSDKQDAIQDTIDRLDDRITDMETRIDQKMAILTNQFIAMEMALSNIQSQSQWLTGQINAASSGWG